VSVVLSEFEFVCDTTSAHHSWHQLVLTLIIIYYLFIFIHYLLFIVL